MDGNDDGRCGGTVAPVWALFLLLQRHYLHGLLLGA